MNKRLVIAYKERALLKKDNDLAWEKIDHQWGGARDVESLRNYFEDKLCKWRSSHLRSAMSQITAHKWLDIAIAFSDHGVRQRADIVNRLFAQWFYDKWWNCTNIIAADYFLGSGVVDIAIKNNKRKFLNQTPIF